MYIIYPLVASMRPAYQQCLYMLVIITNFSFHRWLPEIRNGNPLHVSPLLVRVIFIKMKSWASVNESFTMA